MVGEVRQWYPGGYGFLMVEGEFVDVWVHYSAIQGMALEDRGLKRGQRVQFDLVRSARGPQAASVRLIDATARTRERTVLGPDELQQIRLILGGANAKQVESWIKKQCREGVSFTQMLHLAGGIARGDVDIRA